MALLATYISGNSFSIPGDRTVTFSEGRKLRLDCGADGVKFASVLSSSFSTVTTVTIKTSVLTANLVSLTYGLLSRGATGSMPDQIPSEVKAAYEANPDTNAFTSAEKAKLAGIATGATKTNILYGTGDPPDPTALADGTVYIKYT